MLTKFIGKSLRTLADDIDAGNCNVSDEEFKDIITILNSLNAKNSFMSKYSACNYLRISRSTFDRYVVEGKIPKGRHNAGFKELVWSRNDLDKLSI